MNGLSLDSRGSRLGLTRAASSPTDYISFSLAGNFDFESVVDPINSPGQAGFLTFNPQFHNGSRTPATNYWQVRVSTDDFVSSNIDLGTAGVDPSQSGVVSDPVFDLSGLGLSGNQTLDFRVYLVRSATWNDASMDNLQIQANAIPEPSTFALIGIALGSVLLFRRRKS